MVPDIETPETDYCVSSHIDGQDTMVQFSTTSGSQTWVKMGKMLKNRPKMTQKWPILMTSDPYITKNSHGIKTKPIIFVDLD